MINLTESKYFNSLSKFTQESIRQSGVDFDSEDTLRQFVENLQQ